MRNINDLVNQRLFVCFDDQIYKPLISDLFVSGMVQKCYKPYKPLESILD